MRGAVSLMWCVALVGCLCGCDLEESPPPVLDGDVAACLPADGAVQGLTLIDPPTKITKDELAKLLGAEADIYLAYGFDHAASARYTNIWSKAQGDDAEIHVHIFRMRSPAAAFGAYAYQSCDLEPPVHHRPIGAGATIGALGGHLWKAHCYVHVASRDKSPDGRDMVRKTLKHVAKRIAGDSPRPRVLVSLPAGMCDCDHVRYFSNKANFDLVHWIADADVLALAKGVEGAVAQTADGEATAFVVRYPDAAAARNGWNAYRTFLESKGGKPAAPFMIGEYPAGTFGAALVHDVFVAGVWDAKTAKCATDYAARVLTHLGGALPPPPPPEPRKKTPSTATAPPPAAP